MNRPGRLGLVTLWLGVMAAVAPVFAKPLESPSHRFEGRDLFSLQWAADPQIRPDGAVIAYVRVANDIMVDRARRSIWLVDVTSGTQTPIVTGPGSHSSPRWSPDGKRLAYLSSAEGGGAQLYVRWMESGQTARIWDLPDTPSDIAWSPDGRSIAFVMFTPDDGSHLGEAPAKPEGATWAESLTVITDINYRSDGEGYLKPGYSHVFVVSAQGGAPRQLTFGAYNESGPLSWTPDGQYLLMSGNRQENWRRDSVTTQIFRIALGDGSLKELTPPTGPYNTPRVSPDGKLIAYLGFEDRVLEDQDVRLYVMDRDGGQRRSLTEELDRSIDDAEWAADGRGLYIRYVDQAISKLAYLSLDGHIRPIASGLAGQLLDRPYSGGAFTVASNGTAAFISARADRPPELSVSRGGRTTQLTDLNAELFRDKQLAALRPLQVSSVDKHPIGAWLVTPPDFDATRKYPLILEIHGGPSTSYGPFFATDVQLYAAAGYVVLYANPRGSTSYGQEFANLIHQDYPGHDYDDLMTAVDAAVATGFVDPDKLFVTGGSGGGALTAWIVGKTHRFKAAAAQKPVINWTSLVLTTDVYTYMSKYWFGKMPWEDPVAFWQHSPLSLIANVTTPTMIIVGEHDFRTPASDSEQFYQALQIRGVPTALVKVPGASHEGLTARPSQSAAKASAILAWFGRYRDAKPGG